MRLENRTPTKSALPQKLPNLIFFYRLLLDVLLHPLFMIRTRIEGTVVGLVLEQNGVDDCNNIKHAVYAAMQICE